MGNVVIAGGGWGGCAAAAAARKKGSQAVLLERTDMLLGTGLVGGIMRNNGRFTATEEAIAMGFGDIFQVIDENCRHRDIEFPGHKHVSLYDVGIIEPVIKRYLLELGVEIHLQRRVSGVDMKNGRILSLTADEQVFPGDAFIDTTGTAGGMPNCKKYGNGCAMCILRCPTFGGRISITAKAGVREIVGVKEDGTVGAMSGSCKLFKESLAPRIVKELDETGVCVIPIPRDLLEGDEKLEKKACQQYALKEFAENIILLDTGHAKLMTPFYPLEALRSIPGMENARYEDPYSGGLGNSMRYLGMCPRDDSLKVEGVENLFCGGEKAGLLVGHTEAIVTGSLAGYNAARWTEGLEPVILPDSLAVGDAIAFVRREMGTRAGLGKKFTFSGSVLFERMQEKGLYTTDIEAIKKRVEEAGCVFEFTSSQL